MKTIDRLRSSTLAAWAVITLLLALTMASPYLPHTILHAQQTGPGGAPGGNSGGAVSSVFGRTGAVVAASGDYTAAQVTNAAATNAANTFTASQEISAPSAQITFNDTTDNEPAAIYDSLGFLVFSLPNEESNLEALYSGQHQFLNNMQLCWTGQVIYSSCDTGLSRAAAGVVQVGSGASPNASGTIEAANLTLGGVPVTQAPTQPTGSCTTIGWVLSNDGHITFCNGSAYVSKA